MKKGIFELAIIIWTSLLVLLITGWIMIEFYNWNDTIVAAIIAFVGAIIGGSITLIGVKMTIIETRRKDELELIEAKIFTGEYLIEELSKLLSISKSSLNSIQWTYGELEEPSPCNVNDAILKKHTKFSNETSQIYDGIVSSQLIKKLGYSVYKELKELSGKNMIDFEIDEHEFFIKYYDDELIQVLNNYINVTNNLKTKYEKIHSDNLKRYKELMKQ